MAILYNIVLPAKFISRYIVFFITLPQNYNIMAAKLKTKGRPKVTDKVKVRYIYLSDSQAKRVQGNHKTLTLAVLAKCG